jgi:CBS domain-containing protein/gamma-glutamyl:cysteine ligase YbdK (ATP-grasp superfamily)
VAPRLADLAAHVAAVPRRVRAQDGLTAALQPAGISEARVKTDRIEGEFKGEERRSFMRALLRDLRALERILDDGMLEEGVRRVGAEQEIFLIDSALHPASVAAEMLEDLADPHFTTELGRFNLEMNLDPLIYGTDCLRRMEAQLETLVDAARRAARARGWDIVLTGILPTIRKSDLKIENMTPSARYAALNAAMTQMRGGAYEFYIKGIDELVLRHDSVMAEACNASFQVHFQVGAGEFATLYNMAQAVAGPVLAAATNSPLLFGRRLWAETRIALFQQAVDTRKPGLYQRQSNPRVFFGNHWIKNSVLELYKEDVARFRTLVGIPADEDPIAVLQSGRIPELKSLRLHNGTVYRWNRACYGITDGKPHLRIECRVLPSGPSVLDEIANAAFWFGLMGILARKYDDITQVMEFEHAEMNLLQAARLGLSANMVWLEGEEMPARRLILDKLLPMADEGLSLRDIPAEDRRRYLDVVEQRVKKGQTGSRWFLNSLASMKDQGTSSERFTALTAATVRRQTSGKPVHEWDLAHLDESGEWLHNYTRVEQIMDTDIYTVHPDESVELVANVMEWERIRYVPVEDLEHKLVGLVSQRALLRLLAHGTVGLDTSVADVMRKDLRTLSPETTTLEAIQIMRQHKIGCLPVVHDGRLIGVVTERDFMDIAFELLEEKLGKPPA